MCPHGRGGHIGTLWRIRLNRLRRRCGLKSNYSDHFCDHHHFREHSSSFYSSLAATGRPWLMVVNLNKGPDVSQAFGVESGLLTNEKCLIRLQLYHRTPLHSASTLAPQGSSAYIRGKVHWSNQHSCNMQNT